MRHRPKQEDDYPVWVPVVIFLSFVGCVIAFFVMGVQAGLSMK